MDLNQNTRSVSLTSLLSRGFFITGSLGVALLSVYGRFEYSPRGLHQLAWSFVAVGAFLWMWGDSDSDPEPWQGACRVLVGYSLLAGVFLYPILMSDGDFYYGVIRSILWERDCNTMDEGARYAHGWLTEQAGLGGAYGFPFHPFPLGASLSWIPFIGAGHVEALLRCLWDPWLPLDGYSTPYLNWVAVGTATYGGAFVFFGYLLLRLRFSHSISLRAVLGGLLATPGFYYCFRDSGFPHAHSMAALTFFFWAWLRAPSRRDLPQIGLLAIALSACALIRWQNCLFALAPVTYWLFSVAGAERPRKLLNAISPGIVLGVLCLLLCLAQLVFFRMRGPTWLDLQHGGGSWRWINPHLYSLLFDEKYGLWGWHPFYFLAVLGILAFAFSKQALYGVLGLIWSAVLVVLVHQGEKSSHAAVTGVLWMLGGPLFVLGYTGVHTRKDSQDRTISEVSGSAGFLGPVSLLFFCGALELYIDSSYVLWHGGGEYGNRLIVDLLGLVILSFAVLLSLSDRWRFRVLVALAWVCCLGWSLAVLHKGSPKFTRSPRYLTEILSHGTPFASMVQGTAHADLPLILRGMWLFLTTALSLTALAVLILQVRRYWTMDRKNLLKIFSGVCGLSLLTCVWFWVDLDQVDAALYLDNRNPKAVDLVRQAFNPELTPWFPPGKDSQFPGARDRFHLVLGSATREYSTILPVSWDEQKQVHPYRIRKLVMLSRVWSHRDLPLGEPIAEVTVARRFPPSETTWNLRAGIDTDTPTSLRLPPSSPDWYGWDVSAMPRYFVAELPAEPTQEIDFLKISLIPDDVTLEVGAIWFSRPTRKNMLDRMENPRYRKIPDYDLFLFSKPEYIPVDFPSRLNPRVSEPGWELFPHPSHEDFRCVFRRFQDPWRLSRTNVPVCLALVRAGDKRPPGWNILDWETPILEVPLPEPRLESLWVALAASPIPPNWKGKVIAQIECKTPAGWMQCREVRIGKDIAFWGEPYLPSQTLVWFERRGFRSPIGVPLVQVKCSPSREYLGLRIQLSSEAIETDAQLAVLGITAKRIATQANGG